MKNKDSVKSTSNRFWQQRSRRGDWEVDTILGCQSSGYVILMVERLSGLIVLRKVPTKCATGIMQKTIKIMQDDTGWIHTITADNGKEFARHEDISKGLQADVSFVHPYHSWERGCHENATGLARQYPPKQSSFAHVTNEDCRRIMFALKQTPC
jgi:IS30 family transposase